MDFESAHKAVTVRVAQAGRDVCHQIEHIAVQGQRNALEKVKTKEDIEKLHSSSSTYPNLDGEFQVRQMFEKAMGKREKIEPSYERKLLASLIEESLTKPGNNDITKNLVTAFLVENAAGDFYNENFLRK
jgi:hypothetical protein